MDQSLDLSEEVKSFYLVRHGELKNSGRGRVPDTNDKGLSSDGVLEAELISSFFHDLRISAIFSSPNNSAVETTDIIAKNIGEPTFFKHSGLTDKREGEWDGKTYWQIREEDAKSWEKWSKDPINFCPPNGESVRDFVSRVGRALKDIRTNYEIGEKIILSTHAGVVRAMLILALDIPVDNFFRIDVPLSSISRIDWSNSHAIVKFLSLSVTSKS
jgi:alpha-ribazole phosphatase